MIPLRDTVRAREAPLMNWLIITANVLVFVYETTLGPRQLASFTLAFGMVPRRLLAEAGPAQAFTMLTSMFMHGGWWHLISNMWVLFIFGDNVEDRMGHLRYLLFYLIAGLAAALAHAVVSSASAMPTIGASGAISGVMAAYLVLHPRARVLTLIPVLFIPSLIEVPALVFIGFWFVSQLFSGFLSLSAAGPVGTYGGVAWWAHVGGFLAGLALVKLFERRTYRRFQPDEYWPW